MELECKKCGCKEYVIRKDARGIGDAYCAECGSFIKKLGMSDMIDYYEAQLERMRGRLEAFDKESENRMPCKYCTEKYVMLRGNMHTHIIQVPIDAVYCPMCGRKLSEHDLDY